ncbi:hypothetical protein G3N59_16455 [Paraburkholderia sp. Ac-20340]|uniref:hypothetical protein n=1 Tax=Paraburkholderia sp. Ac-20340 TaxID=2703888 RepID=UPI00197D9D93|nr:hypothetical protein [Paraburkholderia sp. Ac-20340]MBN3854975.1 hypothetical protein [Paraburkholderia sp. Ac-20340]
MKSISAYVSSPQIFYNMSVWEELQLTSMQWLPIRVRALLTILLASAFWLCSGIQAAQPEVSKVEVPSNKVMSPEQQANLIQRIKVGLQWASGDLSFPDVVKNFGNPVYKNEIGSEIEYMWFPDKMMALSIIYRRSKSNGDEPRISGFRILIDDNVTINFPYQQIEQLGLERVVSGEKIDGARTEQSDFYWPLGVISMSSAYPPSYGVLSYRKRIPENSPYDLCATFDYLMEIKSERGPWDATNIIRADNLRSMGFGRHYLTQDELNKRSHGVSSKSE